MAGFEPVIRRKSESDTFSPVIRRAKPKKGGDPKSGILDALKSGYYRNLKGMTAGGLESVYRDVGLESGADYWKGVKTQAEADAADVYDGRPKGVGYVLDEIKEGDLGGLGKSVAYGVAENLAGVAPQAGLMLAKGGIRSNPLMALGTGLYTAAQTMGDIEQTQREKGLVDKKGNVDLETTDYAFGLGSAFLDTLTAGAGNLKGAGNFVKRMAAESAQEGTQEGLVLGSADVKGADVGLDEYARNIVEGAAIGPGTRATIEGTSKVVGKVPETMSNLLPESEVMKNLDEADAAVAERYKRKTKENSKILDNLDPHEGVQRVSVAVRQEIKAELDNLVGDLRKVMDKRGAEPEEYDHLRAGTNEFRNRTAQVSQDTVERLSSIAEKYGAGGDAPRIASLSKQMAKIDELSAPGGAFGGLSRFTNALDITDQSHKGMTKNMGNLFTLGLAVSQPQIVGVGIGLNRAARLADTVFSRRNRIKRYLGKVEKTGLQPPTHEGVTSGELLRRLERARQAEKAAKRERKAAKQSKEPALKTDLKQNEKLRRAQEAQFASYFNGGAIPNTLAAKGLRHWDHFTGGATAQQIMQGLGQIDPQLVEMYKRGGSEIQDVLDTSQIGAIQAQIAQANGLTLPSKEASAAFLAEETGRQVENAGTPRVSPFRGRPSGNRGSFKGQTAHAVVNWLLDGINNNDALSNPQKSELIKLVHQLNRPDMAKDDRRAERDRVLNELFPETSGPKLLLKGKLATELTNLVEIGNDERIYQEDDGTEVKEEPEIAKERKAERAKPVKEPKPEPVTKEEAEESKPEADAKAEDRVDPPVAPKPVPAMPAKVETPTGNKVRKVANRRSGGGSSGSKVQNILNMFQTLMHQREIAESEGPTWDTKMDSLLASGNAVDAVVYDAANLKGQLTQVALTEAFARRVKVEGEPTDAMQYAPLVEKTLKILEETGQIRRKYTPMKKDGKQIRAGGKFLHNIEITPVEGTEFGDLINTGRAIRKMADMVDISQPQAPITPEALQQGVEWKKGHKTDSEDHLNYAPLIDFINELKGMEMSIDSRLMDQVADAIDKAALANNKNNQLLNALLPKKSEDSNARAFTQLLFQMERYGGGTSFFQDYMAQKSGRVTATNGAASSHGGDFMKSVLRAPSAQNLNTEDNFKLYLQSFGNLLGVDKEAPSIKRSHLFTEKGLIEDLLSLSANPAQEVTSETRKTAGRIRKIVEGSEGFFQTLNAANELSDLTKFVAGRPQNKKFFNADGKPKASWADTLSNPEVRNDIVQNYKTDYIIQLDANNNSFQLAGLMIGDPATLQKTGMMERPGVGDPDTAQPADVYVEPARNVAAQIPELQGIPDSKLRKVFKRAISTYIYAAEFSSRKKAFMDGFHSIGGPDPFGWGDDATIKLDKAVHDQMAAGEAVPNWNGTKETKMVSHEKTDKNGKVTKGYALISREVRKTKEVSWPEVKKTAPVMSKDDAIKKFQTDQLISNMNSKLVADLKGNFGRLQEYMNFANSVVKAIKDRGGHIIKVPTKDGMLLDVDLTAEPTFDTYESDAFPGRYMGFRSGTEKFSGKPVAALMAHQNDAFVLRNVLNALMNRPQGLNVYNTIHDSHGFSVGDVAAGQQSILETMKALGEETYNIFLDVIKANGLEGEIAPPARQGVDEQIDTSRIPTAVA